MKLNVQVWEVRLMVHSVVSAWSVGSRDDLRTSNKDPCLRSSLGQSHWHHQANGKTSALLKVRRASSDPTESLGTFGADAQTH